MSREYKFYIEATLKILIKRSPVVRNSYFSTTGIKNVVENNMKKLQTLCVIYQEQKILLGMKKRGFGAGRWNGFGGKVEDGESVEEAAKREVLEEAGLIVKNIERIGIINFEFQDGSRSVEVHIFRSKDFEGQIVESEEMKPEWFGVDELPLRDMWPADAYWLPILLEGKKFEGKFIYDHPSTPDCISKIIEKFLREVPNETEKISLL